MKYSTSSLRKLVAHYQDIVRLSEINSMLGWDLNVNLPPKGTHDRAKQSAYLTALVTDKWRDPKFYRCIEKAHSDGKQLTIQEQAMLRNIEWSGRYYWKVPKSLVVKFAETTSEAFMVWQQAKQDDDFKAFQPYLEKIVVLCRKTADHLGYQENRYDALLNLYEQGLTTNKMKRIFSVLKKELTQLLKKITASDTSSPVVQRFISESYRFDNKRQEQLAHFVLRKMGYDFQAGKLDISPHPFTTQLGRRDVRITTKYTRHDFRDSLTSSIHEGGHALYEQGVNEAFALTPLGSGVSLGIHESQSRFWENIVGRSREFLSFLTPMLQAFYPEHLADIREDDLFHLMNHVMPGRIRIEADEVTYNFHILLRFELEEALVNEKIKIVDLPEVWREKMKKYLQVMPETDRDGVLQDVHWSYGSFGYFPTYTLGNLYAAQFTRAMKQELDIPELLKSGNLGTILSWLRTNIHQYGSLYWPDELIKRVTGEELNPRYFLDYLKQKFMSSTYGS